MATYLGLYYPFIHFRDERWLKLTYLYWDRMARIVPEGYDLRDSDDIRALIDEGYIRNYRPRGNERGAVRAFWDLLEQRGEELVRRYGLHLVDSWRVDPSTANSPAARFGDQRLAYVYEAKIPPDLLQRMVDLGVVERGGSRSPYWIGMHPRLAAVYMTALAQAMADARRAVPVSDDAVSHLDLGNMSPRGMAAALLDGDQPPGDRPLVEAETLLAALSLRLLMPADIQSVPIRTLIKLRHKNESGRAALQEKLSVMVAGLDVQGIDDPDALQDHLRSEFDKHLKPQLMDLRRQLRSAGLQAVKAVLSIKMEAPQTLCPVLLHMMGASNPVVGAAAVALSAWDTLCDYRQQRRNVLTEDRAISYLYQCRQTVKAADLSARLSRLAMLRKHREMRRVVPTTSL